MITIQVRVHRFFRLHVQHVHRSHQHFGGQDSNCLFYPSRSVVSPSQQRCPLLAYLLLSACCVPSILLSAFYKPSLQVPNGKALSSKDLVALLDKETDRNNARLKYAGDMSNIYSLRVAPVAFVFGAMLRVGISRGLPSLLFQCIIVGMLAIGTYGIHDGRGGRNVSFVPNVTETKYVLRTYIFPFT